MRDWDFVDSLAVSASDQVAGAELVADPLIAVAALKDVVSWIASSLLLAVVASVYGAVPRNVLGTVAPEACYQHIWHLHAFLRFPLKGRFVELLLLGSLAGKAHAVQIDS